jgi:hypothetical protein
MKLRILLLAVLEPRVLVLQLVYSQTGFLHFEYTSSEIKKIYGKTYEQLLKLGAGFRATQPL